MPIFLIVMLFGALNTAFAGGLDFNRRTPIDLNEIQIGYQTYNRFKLTGIVDSDYVSTATSLSGNGAGFELCGESKLTFRYDAVVGLGDLNIFTPYGPTLPVPTGRVTAAIDGVPIDATRSVAVQKGQRATLSTCLTGTAGLQIDALSHGSISYESRFTVNGMNNATITSVIDIPNYRKHTTDYLQPDRVNVTSSDGTWVAHTRYTTTDFPGELKISEKSGRSISINGSSPMVDHFTQFNGAPNLLRLTADVEVRGKVQSPGLTTYSVLFMRTYY